MGKHFILLALGLALAGCGGGGGSSSPPTAAAAVQSRDRALDAATKRGDATAIAGFYSESYVGPEGQTKAEAVQTLMDLFETVEYVDIQALEESFTTSEDGTEVMVAGTYQFTLRNKETGETGTFQVDGTSIWKKEGETWRLVSTTSGEPVQVAAALRK